MRVMVCTLAALLHLVAVADPIPLDLDITISGTWFVEDASGIHPASGARTIFPELYAVSNHDWQSGGPSEMYHPIDDTNNSWHGARTILVDPDGSFTLEFRSAPQYRELPHVYLFTFSFVSASGSFSTFSPYIELDTDTVLPWSTIAWPPGEHHTLTITSVTGIPTPVPEPSTACLLFLGLLVSAACWRRRK